MTTVIAWLAFGMFLISGVCQDAWFLWASIFMAALGFVVAE